MINTLRPIQNGRHFPDDIFKCIFFLFENVWLWIKISLKFVPKVRINNIPALVQIMTWRRIGDKPLSEPMMVNLLTHICVTRLQWVNLFGSETRMYEFIYDSASATIGLAPHVTSFSITLVLTIWKYTGSCFPRGQESCYQHISVENWDHADVFLYLPK